MKRFLKSTVGRLPCSAPTALIMLALCGFHAPADAGLKDGLVAYYPFNGNANDESGNGNNGTEYGGLTYANGQIGKASKFDGIDDFIEIKPNSNMSAVGDFSISVWTNLSDFKEQSSKKETDSIFLMVILTLKRQPMIFIDQDSA